MVVVMTWDEPPASAGSYRAVSYDLDLWIAHAPCPAKNGQCGEWKSRSRVDNVEYVIIDNPDPGPYRLKVTSYSAPSWNLPAAVSALIVKGSTDPAMGFTAAVDRPEVVAGDSVSVETTVTSNSWMLSGAYLQAPSPPPGVVFDSVSVTRQDSLAISFPSLAVALGTIPEGRSQSAVWKFKVNSTSSLPQSLDFQVTSENGGAKVASVLLKAKPPQER
jgi:hypothetical protein